VRLSKASGEGIVAELKDGVLTVRLQRQAEPKPRSIEIR
jgi:HSP20 family molecular chaperone IbpA